MAVVGTVTYTTDIAPIMTQHCTSCHGSRGDVNLETYANVKLNADRSLTEMKLGTMPKYSSMPADQIAKFQAWIDGGLLQ
jgi:hypothetical protein